MLRAMHGSRLSIALVTLAALITLACGARSPLGEPSAGAFPDGGILLPDGAVVAPQRCPAWVATHAPVQVSNTASIVQLQSAIPTPSGVLVGYADAQLPQVDSNWHARMVSFGDATLGAEQSMLRRDASKLGWTRVSLAQGFGRAAATASDATQGMLFVTTDERGAPTGKVVHATGDPGRYMLATSSGFSVLRSPFDPSGTMVGPVSLATLDPAGNVTATRTLLDAAASLQGYSRIAFADGSFLLVWQANDGCAGCRAVHARRFSEAGDAMADEVTLRTFEPHNYGGFAVAASARGFLVAWSEGGAGPVSLVGAPFDANGESSGPPVRFAELAGPNAPVFTLAAAPGGDFIAAWADEIDGMHGNVHVQSVGADGAAEGPEKTVAPFIPSSGGNVVLVASPLGAMVLYESDVPNYGIEVYALPLRCGP